MAVTSEILYLTEEDTRAAAHDIDSLGVIRAALVQHAKGEVVLAPEAYLGWTTASGSSARSINMPALLKGSSDLIGTKIINASTDNIRHGLPRASGLTLLFDSATAQVTCVMAAGFVSALRTASVSIAAAQSLMHRHASVAGFIGAGEIAAAHLRLLARHLPFLRTVKLYDRETDRARALHGREQALLAGRGIDLRMAISAEEAVRDSDLVVPVTTTVTPYIEYGWLSPGAVVVNVSLDDLTAGVFRRADLLFVDDWSLVCADKHRLLGRLFRAGEVRGANGSAAAGQRRIDGELGDVFAGVHPGRTDEGQIVVINPFGIAVEDIALAAHIHREALRQGIGQSLRR